MATYETLVAHDRKASFSTYISDLEAYRKEAQDLPEMLHSARKYEGSAARLVVVVRHGHDYHALVSDPDSGQLVSEDPLEALGPFVLLAGYASGGCFFLLMCLRFWKWRVVRSLIGATQKDLKWIRLSDY